jgi:hypothetical protein
MLLDMMFGVISNSRVLRIRILKPPRLTNLMLWEDYRINMSGDTGWKIQIFRMKHLYRQVVDFFGLPIDFPKNFIK